MKHHHPVILRTCLAQEWTDMRCAATSGLGAHFTSFTALYTSVCFSSYVHRIYSRFLDAFVVVLRTLLKSAKRSMQGLRTNRRAAWFEDNYSGKVRCPSVETVWCQVQFCSQRWPTNPYDPKLRQNSHGPCFSRLPTQSQNSCVSAFEQMCLALFHLKTE